MLHNCSLDSYHEMKIRVDLIEIELVENVGTRRDVALQLIATAISLKVREHKVSYRRQTKVVWIDVGYPTVSAFCGFQLSNFHNNYKLTPSAISQWV